MALDPLTSGMNLGKEVVGLVKRFFPEKMSEEQEAQLEQAAETTLRDFILAYEGAAKDYKNIPIIGPIVLLFRGLIRPAITVMVGYLDYKVILGTGYTDTQMELIKAMTLLVMFFWFGERAVQNTGMLSAIKDFFKR